MTIDLDLMPPAPPPAAPTPRRRAGLAGGLAIAVVAVAAVAIVLRPDPSPGPPPPPPPPTSGPLGWVERLVDGPARGALAADREFVDDVLGEVGRRIREGPWRPAALAGVDDRLHVDLQPSLLFADDVGDRRIVLLALRLPAAPDPESGAGRTSVAWLAGPRGATAGVLTSALNREPLPDAFAGRAFVGPFFVSEIGPQLWPDSNLCDPAATCTWVGLAPQDCTVSTSPVDDLRRWTPEPTGSYILRTAARPEYWRVTCDGVVRHQGPAPQPMLQEVPPALVEPATADAAAAGIPDVDTMPVRISAEEMVRFVGFELAGPPRMVWTSQRADLPDPAQTSGPPVPGRVILLAAPTARSTWYYDLEYATSQDGYLSTSGSGTFEIADDPAAPDTVLAAQVDWRSGTILAVARSAAAVALIGPDGTTVRAPVVDGVALLVPSPAQVTIEDGIATRLNDDVRVVALDADGTPIGEATYPRLFSSGTITTAGWD